MTTCKHGRDGLVCAKCTPITPIELAALIARLAALEAEVSRLTERLTPKETPPVSCPECESTDVQRLPWILASEPPQQPWACRICNHRWNVRC